MNSQAGQGNMGTHCYGQLGMDFQKRQFHKLPVCIWLSFCLQTQCNPLLSQPLFSHLPLLTFKLPFYKNMCQFYVIQ